MNLSFLVNDILWWNVGKSLGVLLFTGLIIQRYQIVQYILTNQPPYIDHGVCILDFGLNPPHERKEWKIGEKWNSQMGEQKWEKIWYEKKSEEIKWCYANFALLILL